MLRLILINFATVVIVGIFVKIYLKITTGWCRSQTCLLGKTAIVTGANTGIGYETALDFAKRGARVILACRDEKRAEKARARIIEATGNENVIVRLIDMSSFTSVRTFAEIINKTECRLDILVNNAGAGEEGDKKSKDGHVLVMQINYFSSFLLTNLFIDLMRKTGKARIINVSSIVAKYTTSFLIENIDKFPGKYRVYGHSKLCNILFTKELARKLEGSEVTTYSLHPGAVKTEIFRHVHGLQGVVVHTVMNFFFKTSEEGAQTSVYCSVEKGIEKFNGEHFMDCRRVAPYKTAEVPGLARTLWDTTQNIVQLKNEENPFQ